MRISDWSSDVCSSDRPEPAEGEGDREARDCFGRRERLLPARCGKAHPMNGPALIQGTPSTGGSKPLRKWLHEGASRRTGKADEMMWDIGERSGAAAAEAGDTRPLRLRVTRPSLPLQQYCSCPLSTTCRAPAACG